MRGSRLRDMRALSFASQPLPQSAAKPKHHFALDSRPEVRSVIKSLFFFRGYYCWWWAFDRFDWGSDFRPLEMNFYKQAFLFVCRAPRCNAIQSLDTTSGVHSHWLGTVPNKVDRVVTMTSRSWSSHRRRPLVNVVNSDQLTFAPSNDPTVDERRSRPFVDRSWSQPSIARWAAARHQRLS